MTVKEIVIKNPTGLHARPASEFTRCAAGFKRAGGMARELEADGLYSFEREEEEHICHPAEQED